MKLVEDKDYQIIPDKGDEQAWNVRILTGPFTESVLKYGVVKFNGKGKDKYMSFNFDIVYTSSGSTTTGISGAELDVATGATTAGLPLKCIDISQDPENSDVSSDATNVHVVIQNSIFGQKGAGLA